MSVRFTEEYKKAGAALSLEVSDIVANVRSPFQNIQVVQSPFFGKVLLIDGCVMLTERDEFVYHEMIVHVPLYSHPAPQRILVIGGGDGGTVREIIKHPQVEQVDLVDIDKAVSDVCLQHIPSVASKLLSAKVSCYYEDGVKFVKNSPEKYDVVLIDSTDPINVGEGLFTSGFYRDCFGLLNKDGILVNQAESPFYTPEWVGSISGKLSEIFPHLFFYQAHIPTYPSGHWLFGFASKKPHPLTEFQEKRFQADRLNLKYYNAEVHRAAFALPNFVRELVEKA
ncbi:MAG: polyamine aminopropyltransferase [Calditrichia bacterium]